MNVDHLCFVREVFGLTFPLLMGCHKSIAAGMEVPLLVFLNSWGEINKNGFGLDS